MMTHGVNAYGQKSLSGTVTCPKCGTSGEVSFYWSDASKEKIESLMKAYGDTEGVKRQAVERGGYWHISDCASNFSHHEHTLGGAEIWHGCGQGCFYAPNGRRYPGSDDD